MLAAMESTAAQDMRDRLLDIYRRLLAHCGPQHWWPGESAVEVVIGAILTQSTNWVNVDKALDNLKRAAVLNPEGLAALSVERLAELIRPSGYYRQKARKVRAFLDVLVNEYDGDLNRLLALEVAALRRLLLAVHGIGPETADSIILYAAGKPVFVVDAYTRRIFARLGLCPPVGRYEHLQALFMDHLPPDVPLFNEFHALLVRLGKDVCRKRQPRCAACPLRDTCPTARQYEVEGS